MEERQDNPRRHSRFAWIVTTLLIFVLVIYPLSLGPVVVIASKLPEPILYALGLIYSPLEMLAETTGTEEYFESYIEWWDAYALDD